ncbi:MAG UNVERIFIED_CONTAM: hypothetical protein LVR18_15875 [Planctomycetaceae bacterium]
MLFAMVLAFVQREVIVSELPGLARLLAPSHLILMTIALVFVRGLHELGHAAVCSYFGGECRELGVQLTVFIPFPYCDVSDSWLWPEHGNECRWQVLAWQWNSCWRLCVRCCGPALTRDCSTISA